MAGYCCGSKSRIWVLCGQSVAITSPSTSVSSSEMVSKTNPERSGVTDETISLASAAEPTAIRSRSTFVSPSCTHARMHQSPSCTHARNLTTLYYCVGSGE